jgi:hypothetical protein
MRGGGGGAAGAVTNRGVRLFYHTTQGYRVIKKKKKG